MLTMGVMGHSLVVKISGDIDHHSAQSLRVEIDREYIKNRSKNIIFDFSGVGFMDSSGIGMLMGRYRLAQGGGGQVLIVNIKPETQKIYEISGLSKIMPICDNLAEAAEMGGR